ncbi:unnamed protein product [Periconia digitata]|uniref:Uncharacterized protein n=1 Tax=Periconia digitata TaxID=1303443 RepID=A0A9W4UE98_9PLEO|nr:unnamed protein product [Periconia digitata]
MSENILSLFGWEKKQLPSPPSTSITGVRIPADGTPAHLVKLPTISTETTSDATDSFLFHVPDLREYWGTTQAWLYRDIEKIQFRHQHQPEERDAQKETHLQQWEYLIKRERDSLPFPFDIMQHQSQRQIEFASQSRHLVQDRFASCIGNYYIFYSFDMDNLPQNQHVPTWITSDHHSWYGDVFLVKVAPYEYGGYGWALYEDIVPEFVKLLAEGPTSKSE